MAKRTPRLDLLRDQTDGRYRWQVEDVSSKAYSNKVDCFAQAGRVMGFRPENITWIGSHDDTVYDYGQVRRNERDVIEVFVWKRWWRR